ncbi:MAG TPA: hypothetical protein VGF55_10455 [Gemmataceae bacterium]|jgi:hypothetical protein
MAKPKITTNPAAVTLPSGTLEWRDFTVAGTGLSKVKKANRKKSKHVYNMTHEFIPDGAGNPRDDLLKIWVTRTDLYRRACRAGDTDNLDYTVTNKTSEESGQVRVIVAYE